MTKQESEELITTKKELAFQLEEKSKRAAELLLANIEVAFQSVEKEKRAEELMIANIELAFQNEEKEKRAAELLIANKELIAHNKEKEKREAALTVANYELVFQNEEREKRAAELVIANKELVFQNGEKEKRAAELILANKELVFQNEEREKRAAELIIANNELVFQNGEKGKRAAELILANKELIFQNVEKEKRAEELAVSNHQLETVNKELESFSYSVSHDLRSPVRKITAFATMLEQKYNDKFDAHGTEILNAIIRSSKKMNELIDDLLAFSSLGTKQVACSEINMQMLVESLVEELTDEDIEHKITFTVNNLYNVTGDEPLIRQVWVNLFSNAIKYSRNKPKTEIEVGSYKKDDHVVFYIKDNGVGFDMKFYQRLFGVFERIHSQTDFDGTGIGLAIVQKIIHRHQGTIWAESKPDEGACFYISLPEDGALSPECS